MNYVPLLPFIFYISYSTTSTILVQIIHCFDHHPMFHCRTTHYCPWAHPPIAALPLLSSGCLSNSAVIISMFSAIAALLSSGCLSASAVVVNASSPSSCYYPRQPPLLLLLLFHPCHHRHLGSSSRFTNRHAVGEQYSSVKRERK